MKNLSFSSRAWLLGATASLLLAAGSAAVAQTPGTDSGDQWDRMHNQSQTQRQVDRVKKDDWRAPRERGREPRDWRPENDGKNGRRVDLDRSAGDWLDRERRRRN